MRKIENTAVCDLSASRGSDGVTLLHLAAARGYSEMLCYLLVQQLQVKLLSIGAAGKTIFFLLSPTAREAHASWYNEGPFEGPLKPFGTKLFLYLTAARSYSNMFLYLLTL